MDSPVPPHLPGHFARRAALVIVLVGAAAVIWYAFKVLLLVFAGVLLAAFLDFLAGELAGIGRIRRGWAFAIVVAAISVLLALAGWIAVPRVSDQLTDLLRSLPQSIEELRSYQWGRLALRYAPAMLAQLTGRLGTAAEQVFYGLASLVFVAVLGIYLGANPRSYREGFVRLFPVDRQQAVRGLLGEVGYTLRWWFVGQLVPMGVLGAASMIGLRLLHVRLAFTLGLFTGFMIFIPYIGAFIALIVTVLVTSIQGTATVISVTVLFIGIHVAEGYFLTPFVQRRAVYLPPALTIFSQVLLGVLVGFLGLALATPLAAATLVAVKVLYLHEAPEHHG